MSDIKTQIAELADKYATALTGKIDARVTEMQDDDKSHYLIYRVLGIAEEEGEKIDIYQNKGRFLYKYAGSFLEEATTLCFNHKFPEGGKIKVPNTIGQRPKTFEIDFLNEKDAIEIKWRDATTDGDHITKEHTRATVIKNHGYKPIRVMFYYPQRSQAIKIQNALKTLYKGLDGEYFAGDDAWAYVQKYTDVDFKSILEQIADEKTGTN